MDEITPGPWRLAGPREYPWELEDCGRLGESTLTILGGGEYSGYGVLCIPYSITDGPNMANAHLIAAAPDLLAALDNALNTLCCGEPEHFDSAIEMAKRAIAKAKGETDA